MPTDPLALGGGGGEGGEGGGGGGEGENGHRVSELMCYMLEQI